LVAPALVGNVVVWKPSPAATYSNYIVHQILSEAGVPPGVVQFVPGPPPEVVAQAIAHREFAALHFTGSTFVFKKLWKDIATNIDNYKGYPRIVGETGAQLLCFRGVTEKEMLIARNRRREEFPCDPQVR
jgi:1-pyrroline-5-carboxylate dehydrogenase